MFHKEGFKIIRNTTITLLIVNSIAWYLFGESNLIKLLTFISAVFSILILQFFRNPRRVSPINSNQVMAPADGKIVVLEETIEHEYFKDRRIQVSIFLDSRNTFSSFSLYVLHVSVLAYPIFFGIRDMDTFH